MSETVAERLESLAAAVRHSTIAPDIRSWWCKELGEIVALSAAGSRPAPGDDLVRRQDVLDLVEMLLAQPTLDEPTLDRVKLGVMAASRARSAPPTGQPTEAITSRAMRAFDLLREYAEGLPDHRNGMRLHGLLDVLGEEMLSAPCSAAASEGNEVSDEMIQAAMRARWPDGPAEFPRDELWGPRIEHTRYWLEAAVRADERHRDERPA